MGIDQQDTALNALDLLIGHGNRLAIGRYSPNRAEQQTDCPHPFIVLYFGFNAAQRQLVSILVRVLYPLNRERVALVESKQFFGNRPTQVEWVFCF